MLIPSTSFCTQSIFKTLKRGTLYVGSAFSGILKTGCPGQLPAFCHALFAWPALWLVLWQRFCSPFWPLFSVVWGFFFPFLSSQRGCLGVISTGCFCSWFCRAAQAQDQDSTPRAAQPAAATSLCLSWHLLPQGRWSPSPSSSPLIREYQLSGRGLATPFPLSFEPRTPLWSTTLDGKHVPSTFGLLVILEI